jgi:putative FmdB family regulatory protein
MPIYEYRCKNCKAIVRSLRSAEKMDDPTECDQCGGPALRIFSTPGRFRRHPGWHSRMDGAPIPGRIG